MGGPPLNLERLDDRPIPPATGEIRLFTRLRNEPLRCPGCSTSTAARAWTASSSSTTARTTGRATICCGRPDAHLFLTTDSYASTAAGCAGSTTCSRSHGSGAWCLTVDVDEVLAYPHAERLGLKRLTAHLDRQGAQALFGFMLDMYAEDSLHEVAYRPGDNPLAVCPCFDRAGYIQREHPDFPFRMIAGGLVSRFFYDRKQEGVYLHKVPLVRWQEGLRYTSSTHTPVPGAARRGDRRAPAPQVHGRLHRPGQGRGGAQAILAGWPSATRCSTAGWTAAHDRLPLRADRALRLHRQLVELGLMRSTPALDALAAEVGPAHRLPGWPVGG